MNEDPFWEHADSKQEARRLEEGAKDSASSGRVAMSRGLKETLQVIAAIFGVLLGICIFGELSSWVLDLDNAPEYVEMLEEKEADREWREVRRTKGQSELSILAEDYLLPAIIVVPIVGLGFGGLYCLDKVPSLAFIGGWAHRLLMGLGTFLCVGGTVGMAICGHLEYEDGVRACFFGLVGALVLVLLLSIFGNGGGRGGYRDGMESFGDGG